MKNAKAWALRLRPRLRPWSWWVGLSWKWYWASARDVGAGFYRRHLEVCVQPLPCLALAVLLTAGAAVRPFDPKEKA